MKRFFLATIAIAGLMSSPVQANVLWYNGDTDGVNSYVNQLNSGFQQVLYNDFNVTGPGWTVDSVWSNNIFTDGPPNSTTAAWEIRSDMPTGTLVASGDAAATLTPTGFTFGGSTEYQVLVSGLNVNLAPGTFWLAVYPDDTNGGLAGNETTSGANAVGTPPGNNGNLYFTTDLSTFIGPLGIDTSAGVGGSLAGSVVPEPGSLTLFGLGLASLGAFAWMKKRKANVVA